MRPPPPPVPPKEALHEQLPPPPSDDPLPPVTEIRPVPLVVTSCPGQRLRVAGMRQTWPRSTTEHGERVYLLVLEDLEGMIDVVIPNVVYKRLQQVFSEPGPYVVEGLVRREEASGEPCLRAEQAWNIA